VSAAARIRGALLFAAVLVLLVYVALPFVWMVTTAFKSSHEIFAWPPYFLPRDFTLANIERLFSQTKRALHNPRGYDSIEKVG
jgi:multiple sugar transport system permease protein